ncbi:hypothetical protein BC826DRAFT_1024098 [Russula brevipes]|nr:hypothetical protein BC826DRAFT_1024098 [Russula brevipes]
MRTRRVKIFIYRRTICQLWRCAWIITSITELARLFYVPGEPPQTARIRTNILCISTDKRVYKEHWDVDGSDVLRTRRWSDESWTCSQEGMESLYGAPSIAQQVHAVQVGGNEDAEAGWGKPPYYDHAVLLHSNRTRRTSAADHRQAATGKTIDARREGEGVGRGTRGTAVSWDEADARRAWEATKSRVMYIEEHGALPEDTEDAERASRERRARRRIGWAEDTMRRQTRVKEDTSSSVRTAKKRRRNGGCWISENGVFVRLCAHRR